MASKSLSHKSKIVLQELQECPKNQPSPELSMNLSLKFEKIPIDKNKYDFLAALAALYLPLRLIHGLEFSFRILTKPHQTIPTTYATYFADPPELPSHLTYPPT